MARKEKYAEQKSVEVEAVPVVVAIEEIKRDAVYRVAKGIALTSKRGILAPGEVVTAADFRGENTIAELLGKEFLVME